MEVSVSVLQAWWRFVSSCDNPLCHCCLLKITADGSLFRSVFHSICGLSVRLWHSSVSHGDCFGSVHQPGVYHLLEEDLPAV